MGSRRHQNDWEGSVRAADYSDYSFGSELAVRDEKQVIPTDLDAPPRSTISVNFRSLDSDHQSSLGRESSYGGVSSRGGGHSYVRELSFADGTFESAGTNLSRSRLSAVTVYESTLPMAFDNDRFFDFENGYKDLLEQALKGILTLAEGDSPWEEANVEVSFLGRIWRWIFRVLLHWTCDTCNRLRLTRGLLDYLNFLTAHESLALGGLIQNHDTADPGTDQCYWRLALCNRNVSRILLHEVITRWDWFFHTYTQLKYRRTFDLLGWLPWIGRYADPPSENYASSRWYAMWNLWDSFLELFRWHNDASHNLTPEATGFEQAVCDHFGTHFGRIEFNKFRADHRVTIDESIVRSFVSNPSLTLRNNGVEHVLLCVSKHWREMLSSEHGNFAHQRMELLNPFEALRFHLPATLHVLANLRGRNVWDSQVLAPLVAKLQCVDPARISGGYGRSWNGDDTEVQNEEQILAPCEAGKALAQKVKDTVVEYVCAGIPTRMEPLNNWLTAIVDSFDELLTEAEAVRNFLSSVNTGTQLGYQLLKIVDWSVPPAAQLREAIENRILCVGEESETIPLVTIDRALEKHSPKDERTLRECVRRNRKSMHVAKLLMEQTVRLLEREIRRNSLDDCIRQLSKGRPIDSDELEQGRWYWIDPGTGFEVFMLSRSFNKRVKLVRIDTNDPVLFRKDSIQCREYIPIAEAVSRAQKAYMTIEVDHCKRFSYNAFMEFGSGSSPETLRSQLRRLITLSQVFCRELDNARLKTLAEIRTSTSKRRKSHVATAKAQNVVVIGGGPTGLLCAIHCLQNTLLSGGTLKLYEGRGGNPDHNAAPFERAQIVRLDARQIAMLRYHLGASFEDVFIPLRGDTEAHIGNAIPGQQFVEVTIKRLEDMLLGELVRLRSNDLIEFFNDSMIEYNDKTGIFRKLGRSLKPGDRVVKEEGGPPMRVEEFYFRSSLTESQITQGETYDVVLPRETRVRRFVLKTVDIEDEWYHLVEETKYGELARSLSGNFEDLPPMYHIGQGQLGPSSVLFSHDGNFQELDFDSIADTSLMLDFSESHVVIALGKSSKSRSHFKMVTEEPYGVCCVEGAKISCFMHRFGVPRFRLPIVDDYLSQHLHNTRVLGDFRKSVAVRSIVNAMSDKLTKDKRWQQTIQDLAGAEESLGPTLPQLILQKADSLSSLSFRRERLQCRLFELGNNYYLGMEFVREFDAWKRTTSLSAFPDNARRGQQLCRLMDRLWFEATMNVIGVSHAIRRRERRKVPELRTIVHTYGERLRNLKPFDACYFYPKSCRVLGVEQGGKKLVSVGHHYEMQVSLPDQTILRDGEDNKQTLGKLDNGIVAEVVDNFEILEKGWNTVVVRTSGGYLARLPGTLIVQRASDLSRSTDGYTESKVALASFPVSHSVSNRTMRTAGEQRGNEIFLTAYVGDAQASPHFMRYSGLTGACINCVSFNNMLGQALSGTRGIERAQRFAFETHWSNAEVVRRGTGLCYGFDAFLRPGFSYKDLIHHLYERAQEHSSLQATTRPLLSKEWRAKVAASLVPRGIENEISFYESLLSHLKSSLEAKFEEVASKKLNFVELSDPMKDAITNATNAITKNWTKLPADSPGVSFGQLTVEESSKLAATSAELELVADALISSVHCAFEMKLLNLRFISEVVNQPEPVDSFAEFVYSTQIQQFESKIFVGVIFASLALTLQLNRRPPAFSLLCFVLSSASALGAIADIARTRDVVRNKLAEFAKRVPHIYKAFFSTLGSSVRGELGPEKDPYLGSVVQAIEHFVQSCEYYAEKEADKVERQFRRFWTSERGIGNTIEFMEKLATVFIPGTFHKNSYLQEDLVSVYKALDEYLRFIQHDSSIENGRYENEKQVADVFEDLAMLESVVLPSLPVASRRRVLKRVAPKALTGLQSALHASSGQHDEHFAIRDLTSLKVTLKLVFARNIMVVAGLLLIVVNSFFAVRLISDGTFDVHVPGSRIVGWLYSVAILAAFYTIFRLGAKLLSLVALEDSLGTAGSADDIRLLLQIIRLESIIALVRTLTCLVTIAALLLWMAFTLGDEKLGSFTEQWPLRLSIAAAAVFLCTMMLRLYGEFVLRYNLNPCFGTSVCKSMKNVISATRRDFPEPSGIQTDTQAQLKLFARGYAAREFLVAHRFETILDHDRYSSLLRHLQSSP